MGVTPGPESTALDAGEPTAWWKIKCLNCDTRLVGPFCSECGQRAVPPHPKVQELIGDALGEFVGWDGKLADTLRLLLTKPGELTAQWMAGRRVQYVAPLRLYLTASLIYFVIAAVAPKLGGSQSGGPTISIGGSAPLAIGRGNKPSAPKTVAETMQQAIASGQAPSQAKHDSVARVLAKVPWIFRPMVQRSIEDPKALVASFVGAISRMLFALLPVFACILALFYWGRHYPEHLYFAIHLHSFVFIALTIIKLSAFTYVLPINIVVKVVAMIWIVCYYLLAIRRVYGGSIIGAMAKGVVIGTIYATCGLFALVALMVIVSL